jgi:magnesium and cobalt exporter, CNNM family
MGPWIAIAALILANALYVSAEFSAVGVRRSRIRRLAEDGHSLAKRLLPFIEAPAALDRYVSASQIGITLSSLTLGAIAQAAFGEEFAAVLASRFSLDRATSISLAELTILLPLTAVQVVLGELMPKGLALQYPTEVALFTVFPMRWSLRLFQPFTAVLNGTASFVARLFGARAGGHRHIHSPEEIELLIAESRDGGLLEPEEHRRLHRALQLGLRSARDLMIPRERLTMISVDAPWQEALRIIGESPYSRMPVYRGSPDRVIGMLRVKDVAARYVSEGPLPLRRLIRPIIELREDLPADRVLATLRDRRVHQAIVVNGMGQPIGLVTIQDVLSALLGSARAR